MKPKFFLIILLALLTSAPLHAAETPILEIDTGGHKAKIKDVMFTKDGKYLVSAGYDKTVRVWDLETGKISRVIRGQIGVGSEGTIFAAALSPDNRWLAVGGFMAHGHGIDDDKVGVIRLIDFRTAEVVRLLKGHGNAITSLAFSPDSARLISGSFDKTARIWDVETGQTLHELKGHTDFIYAVGFSPNGKLAVTGSDDDTLRLWNARTGEQIALLKGHTGDVASAAFTPNGKYLLSGSWDKTIRLWDGESGKFIKVLASQDFGIGSLSVSPDSKVVITGGALGTSCYAFSIPGGQKRISFTRHKNIVLATDVSPGGKFAATGGGDDNEIYVWDIRTGEVRQNFVGKGNQIWSVGFSRDGRSIAWGKIYLTEATFNKGSLEQSFLIKNADEGFRLSMGEILKGGDGFIRAIETVGNISIRTKSGKIHPTLQILKNGRVAHAITHKHAKDGCGHRALTLVPDGKIAIAGGAFGMISSYSTKTGEKLHDFIGHTGDVWGVAVSPNGKMLVSGSVDQTVKLWDIATGKNLLTIFPASDGEWVAWTPEGYYDSSINGDQYVGWHVNQGEDKAALFYPASQFAKQFRKPLVVAKYLKTRGDIDKAIRMANAQAPRKDRTERTRASELPSLFPPLVSFRVPDADNVTTANNLFCVKAEAESMNQKPVTDIRVKINGQTWDGRDDKTRARKALKGLKASIDQCVYLTETENKIAVIATTADSQSEPKIIRVTWKPKTDVKDIYAPDLYLLAVGVSQYQKPENNLKFADKDAEAVADAFRAQDGKLYKSVQVKLLTNANATRSNIMQGLTWLERESTQPDVSVIFIAGHGANDNRNNYYFLPHDGDMANLMGTGVYWQQFQDVITNLPSKRILMVDTCHSGNITGTRRRGMADITDVIKELAETQSGVVVMAASTGSEVSVENDSWGHGAFTKAIVEGISEFRADQNQSHSVDIVELFRFITQEVKELTGGRQHPTMEIPKMINSFPIAVR